MYREHRATQASIAGLLQKVEPISCDPLVTQKDSACTVHTPSTCQVTDDEWPGLRGSTSGQIIWPGAFPALLVDRH
jgi:hypothetical protein